MIKANGGKKVAARLVVEYTAQKKQHVTKTEIASCLLARITAELEACGSEQDVNDLATRRPALGLALGIGRYSASR